MSRENSFTIAQAVLLVILIQVHSRFLLGLIRLENSPYSLLLSTRELGNLSTERRKLQLEVVIRFYQYKSGHDKTFKRPLHFLLYIILQQCEEIGSKIRHLIWGSSYCCDFLVTRDQPAIGGSVTLRGRSLASLKNTNLLIFSDAQQRITQHNDFVFVLDVLTRMHLHPPTVFLARRIIIGLNRPDLCGVFPSSSASLYA